MSLNSNDIKKILGEIPLTAELYWLLIQKKRVTKAVGKLSLARLECALPDWIAQTEAVIGQNKPGKKVFVFGMIRNWINYTTLLSLGLTGLGHDVTLGYLPYVRWREEINLFDFRRQDLYVKKILKPVSHLFRIVSFQSDVRGKALPSTRLENIVKTSAFFDTQYSLLLEEIDPESDLYKLRLKRNRAALYKAVYWLQKHKPDVVVVPNGSILEFGMVYQAARYLDIPVSTFEFGEQEERMWLAQNDEVMRQNTEDLWEQKGSIPLSEEEFVKIKDLFSARQGAKRWKNFSRQWQGTPSQGAVQVRQQLGLDDRPLALIPTNVLGDSLTLGRETFSTNMTEWLKETILYFADHPEYQLVIRIHPGEQIGWGPSVYEILTEAIPEMPDNVWLLPADAKVNTYDLVDAADVGMVYTTTTGMEMALGGKPVIVTGNTHYSGKGFTIDPENWEDYFEILAAALDNPADYRLNKNQVELVWRYAYRFFFEYPQPFPWHVQNFWNRQEKWSIAEALSSSGLEKFEKTFSYLTGEKIIW